MSINGSPEILHVMTRLSIGTSLVSLIFRTCSALVRETRDVTQFVVNSTRMSQDGMCIESRVWRVRSRMHRRLIQTSRDGTYIKSRVWRVRLRTLRRSTRTSRIGTYVVFKRRNFNYFSRCHFAREYQSYQTRRSLVSLFSYHK